MKTNLILLIYVVLFFSCTKKQKTYYYPSVEKINNVENRDTIFLENYSDFDNLIKELYINQKENGKQPVIPIKDSSNIYYLNPIEYENTCHLPSRVRRKNKLLIAKDSIMKNGIMFPISKLEYLLRKDLLNNNKEIEYAENHKNLIISFLRDEGIESIENLRNSLLRTFKVFNKINDKDTLELNIDLNKSIIIPPPPSCNLMGNKILSQNENKLDNPKSILEFEKISNIIKSTFNIKDIEPRPLLYKTLEKEYYRLIDSSKLINFKRYSNFLIIEFENPNSAKNEFEKIKTVATNSINNRRNLTEYHHIFSKGGITFNQIDKWIICHFLRCNMNPKDYEIDKKFTSNLEAQNIDMDWITSTCGWGKLEFK